MNIRDLTPIDEMCDRRMALNKRNARRTLNGFFITICFWIFFHVFESSNIKVGDVFEPRKILAKFPVNGTGEIRNMKGYFNFSKLNSICSRDKRIVAIMPVYSAADNFNRRQAIRDTMGRNCLKLRCKIFFIIGATRNISLINALQTELNNKQDILVINKIDTYRDLNNKAVAMLDWLVEYCPQPKYVIHIIDDAYPNIQYFIEHMAAMPRGRYILGEVVTGAAPIRDTSHKWFVSHSEYPFLHYPKYIVGVAYGFLNRDSHFLSQTVRNVNNMWIEDVWFTGMVGRAANFELVSATKKLENDLEDKNLNSSLWDHYFCIHNVDENGFHKIYQATL